MTQKTLIRGLAMTAGLALMSPLAAEAQGRFNGLDRNRDGVITRAEWRGNDTSFRNHDRNGDGVLSGAELKEGSTALVPVWWGYDSNRDGRITRNEWPGVGGDFDVLDTNDDGWLSRGEVNNARAAHDRRHGNSVGQGQGGPKAKVSKPAKVKKAKPAGKPGRGNGKG